jgi:two-component sensor histidine kinase
VKLFASIFGFFMLFALSVNAQTTGELLKKISQSDADTGKVKLLLALSRQILFKSGATHKDIDSAYRYMKDAQTLSLQLKDLRSQGSTYLMAALIFNKKGDAKQGLAVSQKALALFNKIGDTRNIAESYAIIGQHYGNEGQELQQKMNYYKKAIALFHRCGAREREATLLVDLGDFEQMINKSDESIAHLLQALAIYKSIGYKSLEGVYNLLGSDYSFLGDHVNGIKYQLLSLKTAEAQKDTSLQLCTINNRLGLAYFGLQKWQDAAESFKKAAAIARKYHDTSSLAIITCNQAIALFKNKRVPESIRALKRVEKMTFFKTNTEERVILNIAIMDDYLALNEYDNAKIYFKKLIADQEKAQELASAAIVRGIIRYYIATGNYRQAYPYLEKNQELSEKKHVLSFLSMNQLWWFKADSGMGRYQSAIKHYQQHKFLSDSIFSLAKSKQAAIIDMNYKTEKKDKDLLLKSKNIELLNKQALLDKNSLRSEQITRDFLLIGSAMLLLLLGIGYNRYRLKQHTNLQLQTKQAEINAQNLVLENLVIEKDWLLKEVHHRVKNNLQIVMSLLSTQSAYLENTAALDAIAESRNRVQAISLIHQKLYSSNNVASIDLSAYISDLVNYLQDCLDTSARNIRFELLIEPVRIDIAQAVPLGLIMNEAITNAIKYAFDEDGGEIIVALQMIGSENLLLTISDNGKGLSENFDIKNATSLGMEMMKALSKQLGGEFKIKNSKGVTIMIEFQFEKVADDIKSEGFYS